MRHRRWISAIKLVIFGKGLRDFIREANRLVVGTGAGSLEQSGRAQTK